MDENKSLRLTHLEKEFSKHRNLNVSLASIHHCGVSGLASDLDLGLNFFFFFFNETATEALKICLNSQLFSYREIYQRLKVQRVLTNKV